LGGPGFELQQPMATDFFFPKNIWNNSVAYATSISVGTGLIAEG
jgi:hypothetical protein